MLSKTVLESLNSQIGLEFFSSNVYLQLSAWCDYEGLEGSAKFLRAQANEEMEHMQKIFDYVLDTGAMAEIGAIDKPTLSVKSLKDVFEQAYENEKHITKKINELVALTLQEQDFSTFNFLQWYVAEQHEEEKLFKSILDKIEIIGLDGRGLFMIDREIGNIQTEA